MAMIDGNSRRTLRLAGKRRFGHALPALAHAIARQWTPNPLITVERVIQGYPELPPLPMGEGWGEGVNLPVLVIAETTAPHPVLRTTGLSLRKWGFSV